MSLCPAYGGAFCDTSWEYPPSSDKVRLVSREAGETKQFWKKIAALFTRGHYSTDDHKQEWVPWLIAVYLLGMLHTVEDSGALDLFIEGERQVPHLDYWQFVKGGSVLCNNCSEELSFYTAWIGKSIYFLSVQQWQADCSNI